jgi:adenine-specific DNA-methyltransferase
MGASTREKDAAAPVPPYAATKLIAYIGNKRALLPRLARTFLELSARARVDRFLDPFAGSGAVSRLARSYGWRVMASDIEEYSRVVNRAWLGVSADDLPRLFAAEGGIAAVLGSLNRLHPQREDEEPRLATPWSDRAYIARHYAPRDSAAPDWNRERLFYTRENAVFLDRARSAIEERRPPGSGGAAEDERALLLGALVYEAATHANTSGVFKAFHKGFGGHGRDALGRILAPMELEPPLLWGGPPSEVGRGDAAAFCAQRPAELCYLDPPYNQHQYGSNYHMLNTIAVWGRVPVSEARRADGTLLHKAGIPESWKESRSPFCSRAKAPAAFASLFASIDSRFVVLSYNSEGLVPLEELFDMLSDRAEVSLGSMGYVKYRGGRQSAGRRVRNREILLVAERRDGRSSRGSGRASLEAHELELRLARSLEGPWDPERLSPHADGSGLLAIPHGSEKVLIPTYRLLVPDRGGEGLVLGRSEKESVATFLEPCLLSDNAAACEAACRLIELGIAERRIQDLALFWLRKLAHRKHADRYRPLADRLAALVAAEPRALERLGRGLGELEAQFGRRLASPRRGIAPGGVKHDK